MRSLIIVPILALLLVAGCGGGDKSDDDAVRAVVTEGVKSGDAGVCDRVFTREFLDKTLSGGIEQCKRLRKGQEGRVKGFRIDSARVVDDRAEVRVTSDTFGRERYVLIKTPVGWRISGTERLS